jgi:hypothetical protein
MYLMKLPEDGPKCGPKHVAVIKQNQHKQFDWFIFYCCVEGQNTTVQCTCPDKILKYNSLQF